MEDMLKRREGETIPQWRVRLILAKEDGLLEESWNEVAALIDSEYCGDNLRKVAKGCVLMRDAGLETGQAEEDMDRYEAEMDKQRARDERTDLRKALRDTSRFVRRLDLIEEQIRDLGQRKYEPITYSSSNSGDKEMIVILSDLHIGARFTGIDGNSYSIEIAEERLREYAARVNALAEANNVYRVHVVLLGDLVSGNIHKPIAVSNQENVITQIMRAAEMVSNFVYALCRKSPEVRLHAVSGNHSRIDLKDDALMDDRLDRIVPWYVQNVLAMCDNLFVMDPVNPTLDIMKVFGREYYLVHGDYDNFDVKGVSKLAMITGRMPYAVLYAHRHYPTVTKPNGIWMVQSGSLCGSGDDYTTEKRLVSPACQTMLIIGKDGIESSHFIEFGGEKSA